MGGRQWGELDHLLIFAYQRYLDTICPECGGYVLECRDPNNRGLYQVEQDAYCYRKAALEDVTKAKDYKPQNGQLLHVTEVDALLLSRPGLTFDGGEESSSETDGSQD